VGVAGVVCAIRLLVDGGVDGAVVVGLLAQVC
jgi:hypothetical protein